MPRLKFRNCRSGTVLKRRYRNRSYGQFNTKIHCHEKTQLIAAEKGTLYLYSEQGVIVYGTLLCLYRCQA